MPRPMSEGGLTPLADGRSLRHYEKRKIDDNLEA
jgi:hypothetical protein